MGTTARRDIKITKGDDFSLVLRMKYEEAGGLLPLDLTGSTLTLKLEFSDGTDLTYTSAGPELVITDAVNGEATFTLSDQATDALPDTKFRGRWSFKRTIDGTTTKHIAGSVFLIDWTTT